MKSFKDSVLKYLRKPGTLRKGFVVIAGALGNLVALGLISGSVGKDISYVLSVLTVAGVIGVKNDQLPPAPPAA